MARKSCQSTDHMNPTSREVKNASHGQSQAFRGQHDSDNNSYKKEQAFSSNAVKRR